MDTTNTLTREQALALFANAAKGMKPAEPRAKSLADALAPFAPALLQYRAAGYSLAQLVDILKSPEIGITLRPGTLRRFLTTARKRASHRATQRASTARKSTSTALRSK